ncbi:MAG: gamma carbonic anhydrase family protein [Bacteriovoracaceae bacterium]
METPLNLFSHLGKTPQVGQGAYLAPNCTIIGDVKLGEDSSVWFGSVLRGDINKITIGARSNIQDLSLIHVTEKDSVYIGEEVTVGHKVILHGCHVANNCLIGMGAILMDGVQVGANSLVAAGSLLTPGKTFPEAHLIMGNPARAVRELTEDEIKEYGQHYKTYLINKNNFTKSNGLLPIII